MREQDNRGGIKHSDCKSADAREKQHAVCLSSWLCACSVLDVSLKSIEGITPGVVGEGMLLRFGTRFLFFSHAFSSFSGVVVRVVIMDNNTVYNNTIFFFHLF